MPLKGRDYELAIKNVGFEKATKDTLMQLIEITNQMIKHHSELDRALEQSVENQEKFLKVSTGLVDTVQTMQRRITKEEGHD